MNDLERISRGCQGELIHGIGTEKFSGRCFAALFGDYCNSVSSPSGLTRAVKIAPPEVPDKSEARFHLLLSMRQWT